jgi:hypothetical protein
MESFVGGSPKYNIKRIYKYKYKNIHISIASISMGIYTNGEIFGIRIYRIHDKGFTNILFEEKCTEKMTFAQIREAYLFYNKSPDKSDIRYAIYTGCSSTLDPHNITNYMAWHPISQDMFLEQFYIN